LGKLIGPVEIGIGIRFQNDNFVFQSQPQINPAVTANP
jgi:hypothetical protein